MTFREWIQTQPPYSQIAFVFDYWPLLSYRGYKNKMLEYGATDYIMELFEQAFSEYVEYWLSNYESNIPFAVQKST